MTRLGVHLREAYNPQADRTVKQPISEKSEREDERELTSM